MNDEVQANTPDATPWPPLPLAPYGRVMAVTSGKGGVGKTIAGVVQW